MTQSATANTHQVGGEHYKTGGLQHWDVMSDYGVHYLCATATKYIVRARNKHGLEDYRKALHYIEKATEWLTRQPHHPIMPHHVPAHIVGELAEAYAVNTSEETALICLLIGNPSLDTLDSAAAAVGRAMLRLEHNTITTNSAVLRVGGCNGASTMMDPPSLCTSEISKTESTQVEDASLHAIRNDDYAYVEQDGDLIIHENMVCEPPYIKIFSRGDYYLVADRDRLTQAQREWLPVIRTELNATEYYQLRVSYMGLYEWSDEKEKFILHPTYRSWGI